MKRYVVFFLIIICLTGCKESIVKTDVVQSSYNSEFSKDNGVFICTYSPSVKTLEFNDISVDIEDIWVEYLWSYSNINKDISKVDQKNLYLKFKDKSIDVYDFNLIYGTDFLKKGGYTGNKLTFALKNEIPENLELKIVYEKDTILLNLKKNKSINQTHK